jgi:Arc/MetJ-type ribon-helix-helix transcriptional regulator
MKRTTIMLPDELAQLVDRERRRRDVSAAAVIREAVAAYFAPSTEPKNNSIIGIGHSGGGEAIAANMEELLDREWADWIEWDSGLQPRRTGAPTDDVNIAGSETTAPIGGDASGS